MVYPVNVLILCHRPGSGERQDGVISHKECTFVRTVPIKDDNQKLIISLDLRASIKYTVAGLELCTFSCNKRVERFPDCQHCSCLRDGSELVLSRKSGHCALPPRAIAGWPPRF